MGWGLPALLPTCPRDAPHSPQRGGVGQWVAVHHEEVGSPALADLARFRLAEDLARLPGDRRERLPWLEACLRERLHLPCQLVCAARAAAEIGATSPQHSRRVRQLDAAAGHLPSVGAPLAALRPREPLARGSLPTAGP